MKKFTILIILFVQFAFSANSYESIEKKIKRNKEKSDSLQSLIAESEKKISELSKKENEQLSQLNEMEKAIETSKLLIVDVSKQIDSLRIQKEETEKTLDDTQNLLTGRKEVMKSRLIKMYKTGKPNFLSLIIGASSPDELISRIRYMQDLNKYDRNLIDKIKLNERKLSEQTKIYEAENELLKELFEQRLEENERMKSQVLSRKEFLDELRNEKNKWETSIEEFKSAQVELNKIVRDLTSEIIKQSQSVKSNFSDNKGKLSWPVIGKIIGSYGKIVHPEYKTTISNNGIDIEAPIGTPIKSVAAGAVEFVGRMRGYGKLMIINHYGGFLTIYAHLNENFFEKGAKVSEGAVIGSVGESGSLEGSKLHFEVRNDNNALNPIEWLKSKP
ncbi:MAG: peptidoglycan DD-metalloendopeptidase family protein [Chitinispirillales bacterium]|nr:peptidoglycan DD-metalloendopeptidase family protein [Chitinispirillales bacterium]